LQRNPELWFCKTVMENSPTIVAENELDNLLLTLRHMKHEDLDVIVELEKVLFSQPWNLASFEYELEQPYSESYVVVCGDRIVAYFMMWSLLDEMHVLNIAVIPEYRRKGIARWLLEMFIEKSQQNHIRIIHLEVRESNVGAIRLYEKIGFKNVGRRRNYYSEPTEDALLMSYFIV
jgi:[ribosomal protein S18]-alanine N-acetyltransferase